MCRVCVTGQVQTIWSSSLSGQPWTSPHRPWIVVFVSDGEICVFQNGGDWERSIKPQGLKNAHNFLPTLWQMSWACDHVAGMLLILINLFLNWSKPSLRYDRLKKSPTILVGLNLRLKPLVGSSVSATLGLVSNQPVPMIHFFLVLCKQCSIKWILKVDIFH